ncbi:hypothetical protein [Roseibium sp.]|uniref:hypothetical protein n=1 Tax=Roseibium sp. TaxID=1936156 RepID=UPI003B5121D7
MRGTRHWTGTASTVLCLFPNAAFAEVCDKIRPGWDISHGPVSQVDNVVFFFSASPATIVFVGLIVISLLLRNRWMCLISALVSIALATVLMLDWVFEWGGKITESGIAEGCVVPPYLLTVVFLFAFGACLVVALKRRREV